MGYYYDSRRKNYGVRVSVDGKRIFIGTAPTVKKAKELEDIYRRKLFKLRLNTLDNYEMKYEPQDSGIEWLKPFKKWMAKRNEEKELKKLEKLKDLETKQKIEKL